MKHLKILILTTMAINTMTAQNAKDPYQWLEDVEDKKALEWVESWNDMSLAVLTSYPEYQNIYNKDLEILNSDERIATPSIAGNYVYNFWQDEIHQRGIWRRAPIQSYLKREPEWETLLDIDALSAEDNTKWVFKGVDGLYPDFKKFMVSLSRGGGDAVEIKEFDIETKTFVKDGFLIPEAKGGVSWIDENTLMVSTDFGEGITTSGYPLQVKILKRGQQLNEAQEIFRGNENDMGIWGSTYQTEHKLYQMISRRTSFYEGDYFFIENEHIIKPDLPSDIYFNGIHNDKLIFQLKSDWNINNNLYPQGAVVSILYNDLIEGKMNFEPVVIPGERSSVTEIATTQDRLLVNMLDNVRSELHSYEYRNGWKKVKVNAPDMGSITLGSADRYSNRYFFYFQNFLEPSTLYTADAVTGQIDALKSLPSWFNTNNFEVKQFEAESTDGTKIPYFVVHSKDMKTDGSNPTVLYAYGGFEIAQVPQYSAIIGTAWLERGGVYVLANIRGGGEFGPKWHQAGLKENRQSVYDDFHAVAESLISNKITTPQKLGIYGGSNGGLLVGVAITQRPDLYGAAVCAVPLLDMERYNKLLAGASWMAEYGNPDIPEEWDYIRRYSPYHNLKKNMSYPEVFFITSTRDDRVHPGHARKMVAKMNGMGYRVYYFENTEGGHAGASTNEQRAKMEALIDTYLIMKLMN